MRISLLEKREDFNLIFSKTLSDYWSSQFGKSIKVRNENSNGSAVNNLYAHKYFNFIAAANTPAYAFEALKKEYSKSKSPFKSFLLRSYFNLSIHKWLLPFFAHTSFVVDPGIPENRTFIIFGGNTRLRIVFPDEKKTIVLLKNGFDPVYIENEIKFRSSNELTIAPTWIEADKEGYHFTEAYTPGFPLNRLKETAQLATLKLEALHTLLEEVVAPASEKVMMKKYCYTKLDEINDLMSTLQNEKQKKHVSAFVGRLTSSVDNHEGELLLSNSHGDFQEANILLTDDGLKVIDWETVGKRSVTYDFFTIQLQARGRISTEQIGEKNPLIYESVNTWYQKKLDLNLDHEYSKYLFVFIIEEFYYALKSSCSPVFHQNGIALDSKTVGLELVFQELANEKNNISQSS